MNHTQNNLGSFTFSFVKPHLVRAGGTGLVKQMIKDNGFTIVASRTIQLDSSQLLGLYPHLKTIFGEEVINAETLVTNTISEGEFMVIWSRSENTAADFRELVGKISTSDKKGEGIRGLLGKSLFQNAIHGSDTEEKAVEEIRICCPEFIDELLADSIFCDVFYSLLERCRATIVQEYCEESKIRTV